MLLPVCLAVATIFVSATGAQGALPNEATALVKRQTLPSLCNQPANSTTSEYIVFNGASLLGALTTHGDISSDLTATPCQLCRTTFSDPYSRTCTSAKITSCVNGRLVYNNTCLIACPVGFHPDSNSECRDHIRLRARQADPFLIPDQVCVANLICSSTQYLSTTK